MKFIAFPSIESFYNIVKYAKAYPNNVPGPITYKGKVKLHGTNAAVRISKGEIGAQSRSQMIDVNNDNAGFAQWVESTKSYWQSINCWPHEEVTIYGEFAGKGIMKGTALNQIPNKIFAVFAISLGDGDSASVIVEPDTINAALSLNKPSDVHILPWHTTPFLVFYNDINSMQVIINSLNKDVEEVEKCDPWVGKTFGVSGIGEGIVYYPSFDKDVITKKFFTDWVFKAKGEKHKVVATKQAVQIDPEVAKNVDEFVELFVTEARLEQGVAAVGGSLEMKNIGLFLKWMAQDIVKESVDELEASALTWAQAEKAVQNKARKWFIEKSKVVIA